jgi:predicted NAD-dependent protein-ADP-ribosyltransferase YbiA (DUF1768 family)
MKAIFSPELLILVPEHTEEQQALDAWAGEHAGHVFVHSHTGGSGHALKCLGSREVACREPILVSSTASDESARWISNFAPTPFTLDGREYANVEAFWQGLKFETENERRKIAILSGPAAKQAGQKKGYGTSITYEGSLVVPGTPDHWDLMERACRAKFAQNATAAAALLATGLRPLAHRMRRDSRTMPGAIMSEIWTRIREDLIRGRGLEQ